VILVGEIRDTETAAVAVQAAMTGHLVLASVHANTALAVAPRLIDMGIAPFQLTASLKGVVAQRLIRRLCPACNGRRPAGDALKALARGFGMAVPETEPVACGCAKCRGQGYIGRIALAEGLWADDHFLSIVSSGGRLDALKAYGRDAGVASMVEAGIEQVIAGETTLDEVLGVADD